MIHTYYNEINVDIDFHIEFNDGCVSQFKCICTIHPWCWIPNPGVPRSKPLGGSKVNSAFHPSKVGKMSTRNFWELSGKK